MQVAFEATLDEFVDVNIRSLKRSGVWNKQRNRGMISIGLFAVLAVFAIMAVLGSPLTSALLFGVETGIVTALVYPFFYRRAVEKNVLEYCRKEMGSANPFPVQVEIGAEGIIIKQLGNQTLRDWSKVQGIQSTSDGVDVLLANGTVSTVRARAFESPEQQQAFVKLANDNLQAR